MMIRRFVFVLAVCAGFAAAPMRSQRQTAPTRVQGPADQWPHYQNNSNFSPLTQITPQNVSRLTQVWTLNYSGSSVAEYPFVGLDNRFEVQPLLIGGVMYISTPTPPNDRNVKSTVTAL